MKTIHYELRTVNLKEEKENENGERAVRRYALFKARTIIGLHEIIQSVSEWTTFSESDVLGMVYALAHVRDEALLRGAAVNLGVLGTYTLNLKIIDSKKTKAKVTPTSIQVKAIQMIPHNETRKLMETAKFESINSEQEAPLGAQERAEKIMELLSRKKWMGAKMISSYNNVGLRTTQRDLSKLINDGKVTVSKDGGGAIYGLS